jgi:hypothetical protein
MELKEELYVTDMLVMAISSAGNFGGVAKEQN